MKHYYPSKYIQFKNHTMKKSGSDQHLEDMKMNFSILKDLKNMKNGNH